MKIMPVAAGTHTSKFLITGLNKNETNKQKNLKILTGRTSEVDKNCYPNIPVGKPTHGTANCLVKKQT